MMRRPALLSLLLIGITLAAYWPVRDARFINFDDPVYVTNNENVFRGLSWHSVGWAFSTIHGGNWHPVTWLSHMLDCQVFGDKARWHHMDNVAIHAANAVLLFLLFLQMTGAMWRSTFVAALFALHPLHVESVAWISERKDVLSTFFGLLTLMAYVRYVKAKSASATPANPGGNHRLWYVLSLATFILGLMSKPMLVTFPFLMLLLDFWPLRRIYDLRFTIYEPKDAPMSPNNVSLKKLIWEKVPFFILALVSSAVTFLVQKAGGAVVTMQKMPALERFANTSISYMQYLGKAFWPSNLAAFYPFPAGLSATEALLALLLLLAVTVAVLALARRAPYLFVGWLWFVGTLIPVIGLVQVGSQSMADRYTYVPLIGIFVAITWGMTQALERWQWGRMALRLSGVGLLAVCFVRTHIEVTYWQDSVTLFARAVQVTGPNALAQHNLGHALLHSGKPAEAINHFDESLRIKAGYPQAYFNRGDAYGALGNVEKAIADYREAIHYKPDYEQAYCSLAKALVLEGRLEEARTNFMEALRLKPDYAEAHTKLGNLLLLGGYQAEAIEHLSAAVKIQPDYDEGQYYLAGALVRGRDFRGAANHLRTALKVRPGYPAALNDLGWLLATCPDAGVRNVSEAIHCATRACELTGNVDPSYLDTLAVAQSEAGQLPEAIRLTEKAILKANDAKNPSLATELELHLKFYRAGRSYTQGAAGVTPKAGL